MKLNVRMNLRFWQHIPISPLWLVLVAFAYLAGPVVYGLTKLEWEHPVSFVGFTQFHAAVITAFALWSLLPKRWIFVRHIVLLIAGTAAVTGAQFYLAKVFTGDDLLRSFAIASAAAVVIMALGSYVDLRQFSRHIVESVMRQLASRQHPAAQRTPQQGTPVPPQRVPQPAQSGATAAQLSRPAPASA